VPTIIGIDAELDRQRDTLARNGYPLLTGHSAASLAGAVDLLRPLAYEHVGANPAPGPSRVPLLLVVGPRVLRAEDAVPTLHLAGRDEPGVLDPNHGPSGLGDYAPIDPIALPSRDIYLLVDVDRGDEFRDLPPEDATAEILRRGRTPLTIHEGIALATQVPESLQRNHCYSLAGSRRGDRRVPALWISGRAPKLGWCWAGNPHGWLGTASTAARLG
jgi:hypothetical protein